MGHSMKKRLAIWISLSTALVLVLAVGVVSGAGAKGLAPLPAEGVSGKQLLAAPLSMTQASSLALPDAALTIPAVTDAEVVQGYPNAGCDDSDKMHAGYDDTMDPDGQIMRGFIRFDLSAIPAQSSIVSAQVELFLIGSWDYPGTKRSIAAYSVSSPWAEDLVTWNTQPTIAEKYGSADVLEGDWRWYSFDVTNLVRAWKNGTYPNYGIVMRGPEYSGSDSSWREFATTRSTLRPRLVVILGTSAPVAEQGPTRAAPVPLATGNQPWSTYLPTVWSVTADVDQHMVLLLIGVSDYLQMAPHSSSEGRAGAPGYDLMYGVADSAKLGDVMSMIGGDGTAAGLDGFQGLAAFASGNMLALTDSQATKSAIRNAIINWVDARETSQTTVVIFFSGHGTRGPDLAPLDEADSLDEYIVPYDVKCNPCGSTPESTSWDLSTAIRDDELTSWLSELESKRLVVMADSCYSGGIANAPLNSPRSLFNTAAAASPAAHDDLLADVAGPGRLALTASAANQVSQEFTVLGDGVFSYYLLKALTSPVADANHNGSVSGEEAFAYLASRVDQYTYNRTGSHQNPQMYDGISEEVDLTRPGYARSACPALSAQSPNLLPR